MAKARIKVRTSFSKGELSPLVEARDDLAAWFEGARELTNWDLLRQGGITRRCGLRRIGTVKDSAQDVILWPHVPNVNESYVIEVGPSYMRFVKDKAHIQAGTELVTNGTFLTDLVGWIQILGSGAIVWNSADTGVAHLTKSFGSGQTRLRQEITVVVGQQYTIRYRVRNNLIHFAVRIGTGVFATDYLYNPITTAGNATYSHTITATATTLHLCFESVASQGCDFYVDDVSVIQVDNPFEIVSVYLQDVLREIHITQSVDVLYSFHRLYQPRKTNRIADTNWTQTLFSLDAPPTFEQDTDLSGGTITLTPGATTGSAVTFTASAAAWLAGDVGRQIIFGASRATIVGFTSTTIVTADIIDAFPDTNPIPAGSWLVRLSPQVTLDPNIKAPERAIVTLVAGANIWRVEDVGKYIHIYDGVVKITQRDSATTVRGTLLTEMAGTEDTNPAAAPAGAWTLEVASWSATNGFPGSAEFIQGRLWPISSLEQPTTVWASRSNDFENYTIGIEADKAIDHTLATRQLNRLEWIADNAVPFIGTPINELKLDSGREDEPFGGDKIPLVRKVSDEGVAPIQPIIYSNRIVYVDKSRKKIFQIAFDLEEDNHDSLEVTAAAEHVTSTGIRLGLMALAVRPDPKFYWILEDGDLLVLTYFHHEKVVGFTRYHTEGTFEAVCVVPQSGARPDLVHVIVARTINGATVKSIECLDTTPDELSARGWRPQTDCAKFYQLNGVETLTFTGLEHLEGCTVDAIVDGSFRGQFTVASGSITLPDTPGTINAEIGLHYDAEGETMRPAIQGEVTDGLLRKWIKLGVRLHETIGGQIQNRDLVYVPSDLNELNLYTGDKILAVDERLSFDGAIQFGQNQPYPMTILGLFGEIEFADQMGL